MEKLILAILIVVFGSAIFSMIEAALFSVSTNKAKVLQEQKRSGAASLVRIKENMHGPITVVVIFNNLFNIVGSMAVGLIAVDVLGSTWIGLISAIFTFLIIIFSEIIPKSIGESHAVAISLIIARPLIFATRIFAPFIWVIDLLTRSFIKQGKLISEEEIKIMSHLGHMEGTIEADEKEMIQKVFLLNDLTAKDIMTPRTVIEALDADETLEDVEERLYSLPFSRLPIYEENLDNITGVCHQRDLLTALSKGDKKRKVSEFAREELLLFVSEKITADKLIPIFQKQKAHLAIVKDEFGGTAGIVTLEDVLEQLVGEIVDESDETVDLRTKARELKKNGR